MIMKIKQEGCIWGSLRPSRFIFIIISTPSLPWSSQLPVNRVHRQLREPKGLLRLRGSYREFRGPQSSWRASEAAERISKVTETARKD